MKKQGDGARVAMDQSPNGSSLKRKRRRRRRRRNKKRGGGGGGGGEGEKEDKSGVGGRKGTLEVDMPRRDPRLEG